MLGTWDLQTPRVSESLAARLGLLRETGLRSALGPGGYGVQGTLNRKSVGAGAPSPRARTFQPLNAVIDHLPLSITHVG